MSDIKFSRELVTPGMAAALLKNTPHARTINASRVRRYADDMIAGRWLADTAELIKLTSAGVLLGGHHRMRAIVLSGVPCWMHLAHGVDPSTLVVQDSGMPVRSSDWSDRTNAKRGFAMLNSILRAFGMQTPPPSRGCLQEMWDEFGDDAVQFGAQAKSRLIDAPGSLAIGAVWRVMPDRAGIMRDRMVNTSAPEGSPEQVWLRARSGRKYDTNESSAMGIRLATAVVNDEQVGLIRPNITKDAERVLRLTGVLNTKRGAK